MKFVAIFLFTMLSLYSHHISASVHLGTQLWPPYQFLDGRQIKGIAVEAVDCIFSKMKKEHHVVSLPWLRAQVETQRGNLDGFFVASKSEVRDQYAKLSKTFINQEWRIYFLNHDLKEKDYKNVQDFYRLGARLHSNVAYWARKKKYIVHEYTADSEKLISLLQHDRIDAYVENSKVFEYHLKKMGLKSSQFYSLHFMNNPLGIYFGKKFLNKNPGFMKSFNRAVDRCRSGK